VGRSGESMTETNHAILIKEVIHMEQIVSIIQTVGFPIACAIAMFIMLNNEQKQHREEAEKLTATITDLKVSFSDTINQQKSDMVTALNNNTLVLQKLIDKMDGKQ
jgi:hypothetical protein